MADEKELATRFRDFARTSAARAPLYAQLSAGIAEDPATVALLRAAPEGQQSPVLLFAAVHFLVLGDTNCALRRWYPNLAQHPDDSDPLPVFVEFCERYREELTVLIASRSTQTNEVGRCAQFLPALGLIAEEVGELAHLDVGASAGLNLLLPHFQYNYSPGGVVGAHSTVVLDCATRGDVPVPSTIPRIGRSIGLDIDPIDVTDDEAVRWLEACVWPDQLDRFARLLAAVELARLLPPDVRRGDAVADLPRLVDEVAGEAHPVVTNSWVLSYLSPSERRAYVDTLNSIGSRRDLSWVIAESPRQTPELPVPSTTSDEELTVVSLVTWRSGVRDLRRLATTHPHGYWLHWQPNAGI